MPISYVDGTFTGSHPQAEEEEDKMMRLVSKVNNAVTYHTPQVAGRLRRCKGRSVGWGRVPPYNSIFTIPYSQMYGGTFVIYGGDLVVSPRACGMGLSVWTQ